MKILTLFVCAIVPLMASAIGCPSDWHQFGQMCFLYNTTTKTWAQAETYCLSQGGHLTSIHSPAEYSFLQSLTSRYTWVGGYDGGQEGVWFWTDGTRLVYQNWAEGEPTGGQGQHCMAINWSGQRGWDDGFCNEAHHFICAKNMLSPK